MVCVLCLVPYLPVALFAIIQAVQWAVQQCTAKPVEKVKMADICPECVDGVCPMPGKGGKAAPGVRAEDGDVADDDSVATAASEPREAEGKKEA